LVNKERVNIKCRHGADKNEVLDSDIIVCRCMEVKESAIRKVVRQGAATVDAVKRATKAGMGLCQSKTCFDLVAKIINEETGIPVSDIKPMKIRIPVRPLKIKSLNIDTP